MHNLVTIQFEDSAQCQCMSPADLAIHPGDQCIIDDHHILEYCRIVTVVPVESNEKPCDKMPVIIRRATLHDRSKAEENAVVGRMARVTCRRKAQDLKLDLRILHVRYSFDRVVLTVTFVAEGRIDFRELVRLLASELACRIEMKQLGVRDVARTTGGMAVCGRHLCCCSWMKNFEAVNIKMAKNQRLSLNPGTISGMCGRLKCCLRYENDAYRQMSQSMPHDRSRVMCPAGEGMVIDLNVISRRVKVCLADGRVLEYDAAETKEIPGTSPSIPKEEEVPHAQDTDN